MERRLRRINPAPGKPYRLPVRTMRLSVAVIVYVLVFVLLAIAFMYSTASSYGGSVFSAGRSRDLFYFLSGAQLVLIAFVTPGLMARAVKRDREKHIPNKLLAMRQTSFAIVIKKLVTSLSFVTLLILSTIPLYFVAFLFGGIAPAQLAAVFFYYLFVLLVLGSFGVFFSLLCKKTSVFVIAAYGATLFIFGGTGLIANILAAADRNGGWGPGISLGLNPMGALLSIFNGDISIQAFGPDTGLQLWHIFLLVYAVVSILLLRLSVRYLRLNYRPAK